MEQKISHSWDVEPREAIKLQKELASRVSLEDRFRLSQVKRVLGADVSYSKRSNLCFGSVVVFELPGFKQVEEYGQVMPSPYPYIPGLLSFREAPVLIEIFKRLREPVELMIFDAQGIAHPRRLGLASHLGVLFDLPSIGCAKTLLCGVYRQPGRQKGSHRLLYSSQGRKIGYVVRTRTGCRPLFISPGHHISLTSSLRVIQHALGSYRIPEVVRIPHLLSSRLRQSCEKRED